MTMLFNVEKDGIRNHPGLLIGCNCIETVSPSMSYLVGFAVGRYIPNQHAYEICRRKRSNLHGQFLALHHKLPVLW